MIEDLKPYPQYKDSGLPWLGQVPAHWEIARSKRLFRQRKEFANPEDQQLSATQAYGVISQALYEKRTGYRVVKISMHLDKRKHVEAGDFVISMRSFQGGLERAWEAGAIRSSYVVLKPSAEVSAGYFQHLFKSNQYINALRATSDFIRDGQDLNFGNFCGVALPLIPLQEQTAIARFLAWATNRLDRAIRAKRRIIALLQEQKQAIIHRAVTRGLDPFVPLKDSGIPWLGDVPEHWELRRLKMLCSMKSGEGITSESFVPAGQYPVYGGNGIRGYTSSFTHDGNFALIGRQGALCGNVHLAAGRFWASEHALVTTLRAGNDLGWFIELIRSMNLNQYSAAAAQPGLAVEKILNLAVPMPPPLEQVHISTYASRSTIGLEKGIQHASAEITLLREYRTRLIADVVTGKLDVREAAGLPDEELQDQPDASAGYDADDSEEDAESDQIDTADD
jgi:type I restriction enzyme S subunit